MYKKLLLTVALGVGLVMAGAASATPVPATRTFTLDSKAFYDNYSDVPDTLLLTGDIEKGNNLNENTVIPVATNEAPWLALSSGDKWFNICGLKGCGDNLEDSIKVKQTSKGNGEFTIAESIWKTFSDVAIGLKFGGTQSGTPDWAIFNIADGASFGKWSTNLKYDLSHVTIFAKCAATPPTEVPLPGAAWMMLIGLTGYLGLQRKKSAIAA